MHRKIYSHLFIHWCASAMLGDGDPWEVKRNKVSLFMKPTVQWRSEILTR